MDNEGNDLGSVADGVFEALQERSRRSRDAFIESGFVLLNQMRFNDLKISDLAQHSGRSVGSFYKRFEDKEAFFRALQLATVKRNRKIIERRLAPDRLAKMSAESVLYEFVDILADIFSSEMRGVLRESLLRIHEPEDGWAPMRKSGQDLQNRLVARLKAAYPNLSPSEAERKLRFCYQIIVGVLQNDLVNDSHTFSTKDHSIRRAIKAVLQDHMASGLKY